MAHPFVLDNTLGAEFIGAMVAGTLYGVSCVQTWFYFDRYPTDPWYIKTLVCAVWAFDTAHQALITHTVYTYVITNYGNPVELGNLVWSLLVEVLFNGFTALLVQGFLTFRVWNMSHKSVFFTTAVLALVLAEFGCVIAYVVKALQLQTFAQLSELKNLSMAVNAVAAAGDVLIAAVLCTMLHRSRTGFQRSNTIIRKLMVFTLNTGFLTSLCAVASLVSIVAAPNTFIYICFYFSLGRLYSNSLLATLNARKRIRGDLADDPEDLSLSMQALSNGPQCSRAVLPTLHANVVRGAGNISIKIDTTKEYVRDHDSPISAVSYKTEMDSALVKE